MICGGCGEKVEDHVRFHWAKPYMDPGTKGHYVDATQTPAAEPGPNPLDPPPVRPPRGNRDTHRAELFAWMDAYADNNLLDMTLIVAPPPGLAPSKPWYTEDDFRWKLLEMAESLGYKTHNLEQGHRPDGGHTRVSKGLPDAYIQGHGVTAWIETKRWDNDQTPEQAAFMVQELDAGGVYLLIYTLDQFMSWHFDHMPTGVSV